MASTPSQCPTITGYEYVIIGSGPGGGPLAANLARAGHKVLLLEAGDDQGQNLNEKVPLFSFQSTEDATMRWDYFVKHYSDPEEAAKDSKMVWITPEGTSYIGTDPPEGSTMKGIYYPRAGTLGGCASHNALVAVLPHDADWQNIADITNDHSWAPARMRGYFERMERCNYLPRGSPGHGFDGWFETSHPDPSILNPNKTFLEAAVKVTGEHSSKDDKTATSADLPPGVVYDINAPHGQREDGTYVISLSMTHDGRRSSGRNYLVATANARNPDGSKRFPLDIKTRCLATQILFEKTGDTPRAIGVEFFEGQSMYKADPRYDPTRAGIKKRVLVSATGEVVVSCGAFNTPQLLKLSGVGPKQELEKFSIPLVADLPGVGRGLQDNYEFTVISESDEQFSALKNASFGIAGDSVFEEWVQKGTGLYASNGLAGTVLKKTEHSHTEDILLFGGPVAFTGYYPGYSRNAVGTYQQWTWDVLKYRPRNESGTVELQSGDPFEVPEINFRYFEPPPTTTTTTKDGKESADDGHEAAKREANDPDHDLAAMAEGVELARAINAAVGAPIGPLTETTPGPSADVRQAIRDETFGHHAAASCRIGADGDPLAVLDARFRVRGVAALRVVDASAWPRVPGTFPALPTAIMSEKAADVILQDRGAGDKVLDGLRDELVLVEDAALDAVILEQVEQDEKRNGVEVGKE